MSQIRSILTTNTFNFTPDQFELGRMQKFDRTQDWDAGIDLAYRNILYDELRQMWVKVPEPDFDRRRSGGHDTGQYDAYLQHAKRIWDGQAQHSPYWHWHDEFVGIILSHPWQKWAHGHLDPFPFVLHLFDAGFTPDEAVELFVRADVERHARLWEAVEVGERV